MVDRPRFNWSRVLGNWSAIALFLVGALALVNRPAAAQAPGPEVCANCHAAAVAYYSNSVHGQKGNLKGPSNAGQCALCHGDATEHVKAGGGRGVGGIRNPGSKSMAADDKNALCLTCHSGGSKRTHWDGSTHQARGNACTSCHTMHTTDRVLTKSTQPEVCFTCHKQQRAEVNRTFRHPILEGKVVCSDCHNPHGSIGKALMKRDSVVETCYQCHAEKRGPFVHSHEPVNEDCTICHNPHGTVADSMLKLRPPFLCHQCHTPHGGFVAGLRGQPGVLTAIPGVAGTPLLNATTGGKSQTNFTQARGCLNCHTQIHGGNNPAFTNPTPQFMFR